MHEVEEDIAISFLCSDVFYVAIAAHKLAAFQFYTFVQSKGKFVVVSLSKLGDDGDYWTEPVIHSTGKSLGDRTDEGDEGISKWMNEFSRVYSSMLQLSQEEIFTLEPKQFVRRLYLLGAFEVVRSPVVWKPSAEKSKDDEGLIVTSVQSPASSNWPQPESARMSLGVPRLYKDADAHVIVSGESSLVKMSSSGSISTRRGVRFSGQSSDVDG